MFSCLTLVRRASRSRIGSRRGFTDPGSGTFPDPPVYLFPGNQFRGIDPMTGEIQRTANNQVLHPDKHEDFRVAQGQFSANRVILPSMVRNVPNPAVLIGWEIADENNPFTRSYTIEAASYVNGETILETDPADGDLSGEFMFVQGTGILGLFPRFYSIETDGRENDFPTSVSVKIEFQGANLDPMDPTQPDLTTLVPNPNNLLEFSTDVTEIVREGMVPLSRLVRPRRGRPRHLGFFAAAVVELVPVTVFIFNVKPSYFTECA